MLGSYFWFWDPNAPIKPPDAPPVGPSTGPWGSKTGDDYRPLPDEYWEHRAGLMTEDRNTPREIFDDAKALITKAAMDNSGIAGILERKKLLTDMTSAGSVDDLKSIAARLRNLRK